MLKWEAYEHTNGGVQIKRMPFSRSTIDRSSPFVRRYLGTIEAIDREDAEKKFQEILKVRRGG